MSSDQDTSTKAALDRLYRDAVEIYERCREEVTIEKGDGTTQHYAPVRFMQEIEKARDQNALVPTIARILRRPSVGFSHLQRAGRPDLMLEALVLDSEKPYHRLFTAKTIQIARQRMAEYRSRARET